ncbi:MAG: hypothetical protein IJZ51_05390 [Ruminiclostridium sp.]|nr:hypothetical protein [Ruminiclostridium sp.]
MSVLEDVFKGSGLDKDTHIAQRRELYSKDKSLLQDKNIVISPENIDTAGNGRLTLQYDNTDFECFLYRKDSSDKLYVLFSGARKRGAEPPVFARWSYYNYTEGTILNIADPMFRDFDDLELGWYYGDNDSCYVNKIARLARIVATKLGKKEIIFFGSSGGGFAALLAACNCVGSTAIALNAQIKPVLWAYRKKFEAITGMSLTVRDGFFRNNLPELIKESVYSRFIIIDNMYSENDKLQMASLCDQYGTSVQYGLNKISDNVLAWVYDADRGEEHTPHSALDFPMMFFAIEYLYEHFDDCEKLKDLFLIFGEFWAEHFDNEQKLKELKKLKEDKKKFGGTSVISVYDESEHTVIERIVQSGSCEIEASDSIWNNKCVCDELCKNKLYKIKIINPVLSQGHNQYSLTIRDNATNELLMDITLPAGKSRTIVINTEKHSHSAKLKLYSGIAGKTEGISLKADVDIYEIAVE